MRVLKRLKLFMITDRRMSGLIRDGVDSEILYKTKKAFSPGNHSQLALLLLKRILP